MPQSQDLIEFNSFGKKHNKFLIKLKLVSEMRWDCDYVYHGSAKIPFNFNIFLSINKNNFIFVDKVAYKYHYYIHKPNWKRVIVLVNDSFMGESNRSQLRVITKDKFEENKRRASITYGRNVNEFKD